MPSTEPTVNSDDHATGRPDFKASVGSIDGMDSDLPRNIVVDAKLNYALKLYRGWCIGQRHVKASVLAGELASLIAQALEVLREGRHGAHRSDS